jgi:hypothetical protein
VESSKFQYFLVSLVILDVIFLILELSTIDSTCSTQPNQPYSNIMNRADPPPSNESLVTNTQNNSHLLILEVDPIFVTE